MKRSKPDCAYATILSGLLKLKELHTCATPRSKTRISSRRENVCTNSFWEPTSNFQTRKWITEILNPIFPFSESLSAVDLYRGVET